MRGFTRPQLGRTAARSRRLAPPCCAPASRRAGRGHDGRERTLAAGETDGISVNSSRAGRGAMPTSTRERLASSSSTPMDWSREPPERANAGRPLHPSGEPARASCLHYDCEARIVAL